MIRIRDEPLDGVADPVHLNGHECGETWPPRLAVADLRLSHMHHPPMSAGTPYVWASIHPRSAYLPESRGYRGVSWPGFW